MENRLKKRFGKIVKSVMNIKQTTASGIGRLFDENKSFAQVQGAWRFFNNEKVTTEDLNKPILETGLSEIKNSCNKYLLMMTDWSHIDFKKHYSKEELIKKSNRNRAKQIGYELQTTIAVSDKTGKPLSPVVHNLKTDRRVLSTYSQDLDHSLDHFEEFEKRVKWIKENFQTEYQKVHIIDREGDVAGLYRDLEKNGEKFLIRGKRDVNIYNSEDNKSWKQGQLAKSLSLGKKFKSIKYKNKSVDIYVNKVDVEIRRATTKKRKDSDGKNRSTRTTGEPVKARLTVSKLVNSKGDIVETWILISNIFDVSSEKITEWYWYRWKIESFFKLLKTSGFYMENWQEKSPEALFRKLLVVSYSSLLVWQIENSSGQNADKVKEFLVRLSGRGLEYGKKSTLPSLLAGLWVFFQMIETLNKFDKKDLLDVKSQLTSLTGFHF